MTEISTRYVNSCTIEEWVKSSARMLMKDYVSVYNNRRVPREKRQYTLLTAGKHYVRFYGGEETYGKLLLLTLVPLLKTLSCPLLKILGA